ncbi:MAG: MBL fold metallo-hydrolase [Microbacterium sp.]
MTETLTLTLTLRGHSCVLVEVRRADRRTRLLLDPGSLTPALQACADLDGILVTHAHPDHITADQVRAVRGGAAVPLYGDAASCAVATDAGLDDVHVVEPGTLTVGGVDIDVTSWAHEVIYPGVPLPVDYGFHIAGAVFAPGDAFARPEHPVDVLLLPTGAPWMKLSETIDYLRAVAPRIAIPVHDGGLAAPHQQMHRALIAKFAPEGTTVLTPPLGEPVELAPAP